MAKLNTGEREYYLSEAARDARMAELNAGGQTCRYKTFRKRTFNRAHTIDGAIKMEEGASVADEVMTVYSVELKEKLDDAFIALHPDLDHWLKAPTRKIPPRKAAVIAKPTRG